VKPLAVDPYLTVYMLLSQNGTYLATWGYFPNRLDRSAQDSTLDIGFVHTSKKSTQKKEQKQQNVVL
jgi:hypothetical protein